jgi:hypothetical protein
MLTDSQRLRHAAAPVPVSPVPVSPAAVSPAPALPEPVTAVPVTAVPVTAIVSPPQIVIPTSIMPAVPYRYPVPPAAAPYRQPQLPPPQPRPQLAAAPHPATPYPTGGYPTVPGPHRTRPPVGVLLLGLLIGLLVFGSTGYLVGSTSSGSTVDDGAPAAQEAGNRRRVGPVLAPLADGWVPWLGACLSSSEANGPAPRPGEQLRVRCAVDSTIDVFFVLFASAADRDKARATRQAENAGSVRIAAGAAPVVAQRAGTSGRTTGAYIEFAYQNEQRTYGGIWWDDSATTGAAYIEKQWTEGDGGWRPLRDLWQRYT